MADGNGSKDPRERLEEYIGEWSDEEDDAYVERLIDSSITTMPNFWAVIVSIIGFLYALGSLLSLLTDGGIDAFMGLLFGGVIMIVGYQIQRWSLKRRLSRRR